MNMFDGNTPELLKHLADSSSQATIDYVLKEMTEELGDSAPNEKAVRDYLLSPETDTQLSVQERFTVIDKLLEHIEVNVRTMCDMVRYKFLRDAGMVSSVDEFLSLLHDEEDD